MTVNNAPLLFYTVAVWYCQTTWCVLYNKSNTVSLSSRRRLLFMVDDNKSNLYRCWCTQAWLHRWLENTYRHQWEERAGFEAAVSWSPRWRCNFACWNFNFRAGGHVGGVVSIEQVSRPYKAKGMSGWIWIRGGWEREEREKWARGSCVWAYWAPGRQSRETWLLHRIVQTAGCTQRSLI